MYQSSQIPQPTQRQPNHLRANPPRVLSFGSEGIWNCHAWELSQEDCVEDTKPEAPTLLRSWASWHGEPFAATVLDEQRKIWNYALLWEMKMKSSTD
jgi:hypothetical protein